MEENFSPNGLIPEALPLQPFQPSPVPELATGPTASGTPGAGSFSMDDLYGGLDNQFEKNFGQMANQNDKAQGVEFSSKETGFWNIYNTFKDDKYQELGFDFTKNNDDLYARNLSRMDKLGISFGQMGALATESFKEGWKHEGQFWANLATGDFSKAFSLDYNPEELQDMFDTSQQIASENYTPLSLEEQNGDFGFGKFSSMLGQFGFTLGTMGQMGSQAVLEWGAATLAAPFTEGLSFAGAAAGTTNAFKRLLSISHLFNGLRKMDKAVEAGDHIRKAYNYLADGNKLKSGFGDFYRFTKEFNAASSEAKFEAAQTYGDLRNSLYEDAISQDGLLNPERQAEADQRALEAATHNGTANTVLLFAMNRMNMNNIVRGSFGGQSRVLREFGKDLIQTKGKDIWKASFDVGLFTKAGMKHAGKQAGEWAIDSGWEGVQEILQGSSSDFWTDTAKAKFNHEDLNLARTLGTSLGEHIFSQQGLEEFISGFVIGAPGSMINYAVGKGADVKGRLTDRFSKTTEYKDSVNSYKETVRGLADDLNKWHNDPLRIFDPKVANYNTQKELAVAMDEAAKSGNIYAYKNLNRRALQEMVMTGLQTGKLDYMLGNVDDMVEKLSDADFEKTFGMAKTVGSEKTVKNYVENLKQTAKSLSKEYDKAKQKMPNPFANFGNTKGAEREDQVLAYHAWENAVSEYVFNKDNVRDIKNRMDGIFADINTHSGGVAADALYTLTNSESVKREQKLLKDEIANLQSDTSAEGNKLRKQKEEQLLALDKWKSFSDSHGKNEQPDLEDDQKFGFHEYLNSRQRAAGMPELTMEQIEDSGNGILDFMELQRDHETTVANISLLASPEGFKEYHKRHYGTYRKILQEEIIRRTKLQIDYMEVLNALGDEDAFFDSLGGAEKISAEFDRFAAAKDYDSAQELIDGLLPKFEAYKKERAEKAEADLLKAEQLAKDIDNYISRRNGKQDMSSPEDVAFFKDNESAIHLREKAIDKKKRLDSLGDIEKLRAELRAMVDAMPNDMIYLTHVTEDDVAKKIFETQFKYNPGSGLNGTFGVGVSKEEIYKILEQLLEGDSPHRGQLGMFLLAIPKSDLKDLPIVTDESIETWLMDNYPNELGKGDIPTKFNFGYFSHGVLTVPSLKPKAPVVEIKPAVEIKPTTQGGSSTEVGSNPDFDKYRRPGVIVKPNAPTLDRYLTMMPMKKGLPVEPQLAENANNYYKVWTDPNPPKNAPPTTPAPKPKVPTTSDVVEVKEKTTKYTDIFDVSAVKNYVVDENVVDDLLSSTTNQEKNSKFDRGDDLFNALNTCNL